MQISNPQLNSLIINMTMLDEIEQRVSGFKQIVFMVNGVEHRYDAEQIIRALEFVKKLYSD